MWVYTDAKPDVTASGSTAATEGAPAKREEHPAFTKPKPKYNTFTASLVSKLVKQVDALPSDEHEPSEQTLAFRKGHRRSHMSWSAEEDELLRYALEHTNTPDVLERVFRRSRSAIKSRARKLVEGS